MRYYPDKDFPAIKYLPGMLNHPEKTGHLKNVDIPHLCLNPVPWTFLYGIDLFHHSFFWEAHVYWETNWNAHHRNGPEADFLKALIQLAAAKVKLALNQEEVASQLLLRSIELLYREDLATTYGPINTKDLLDKLRDSKLSELKLLTVEK